MTPIPGFNSWISRTGWGSVLLLPLQAMAHPGLVGDPGSPAVVAGSASAIQVAVSSPPSGFDPARYEPAVLRLTVSPDQDPSLSVIDLTLIPARGELVGRRLSIPTRELGDQLRDLYGRLARQQPLGVEDPTSSPRRLHQILLAPLEPELRRLGVTTLLISADPGLQAIPFAALHDGSRYLGESFSMALTPSLGLMSLEAPGIEDGRRQLAVGASSFEGLAPLPLVPQELKQVASNATDDLYVDSAFTPGLLLQKAADDSVDRVHVATHAEFLPGGPAQARLHTGTGPMGLREFASLRRRRAGAPPLDLLALSACRTALGDKDSELGFAGLALQAGARSAIGTLWYVDDVATSAFFVQFYRYLSQGLPKAEALQATRRAMASGSLRLDGDRVIGPAGDVLLSELTTSQQRRIEAGLSHPYYWAGITLMGTPW